MSDCDREASHEDFFGCRIRHISFTLKGKINVKASLYIRQLTFRFKVFVAKISLESILRLVAIYYQLDEIGTHLYRRSKNGSVVTSR